MNSRNHPHWPRHIPHELTAPEATLSQHLDVTAQRYPNKPAFIFYGAELTFGELHRQVEALAGYLQARKQLQRGDRVLLCMQNCPQFVVGYYAVLRAGGVVVPANPMYRRDELRHLLEDTGAKVILCGRELLPEFAQLEDICPNIIAADYRDALPTSPDIALPEFLRTELPLSGTGAAWSDVLAEGLRPSTVTCDPRDLCMILYSSGTTGRPKGCMHSHWALGRVSAGVLPWMNVYADSVLLLTMPLFHIAGMVNMMISTILCGSTVVISTRWDRDVACQLTDRYRISHWTMMPTMIVDLLSNPRINEYRLDSVTRIGGGGASMPDAVSEALEAKWGVRYLEGYGLSESGHALSNPPQRAKRQCLGIPLYDIDARVVELGGTREVAAGEDGEILLASPSLFMGYWNNPEATKEAFVDIDGKRFLRTGDLGRVDDDGYFFIADRLKRMINASGFKVWPAEVEAMLHGHPAILEACVVGSPDPYRGETVKAVVSLREGYAANVTEGDIIAWSKERMAAYKYPRVVEFMAALPKTATGKVDWRSLQKQ